MGPVYYHLVHEEGLSFADIGAMSWPQIECLLRKGKTPGGKGGRNRVRPRTREQAEALAGRAARKRAGL
jgi:hypothetical protein